jgi:hypothetical protein
MKKYPNIRRIKVNLILHSTCSATGTSCTAGTFIGLNTPCGVGACTSLCNIASADVSVRVGTCQTCISAGNVCRTSSDCCNPSLGCGISLLVNGGVTLAGSVELGFYGFCGGISGLGLTL